MAAGAPVLASALDGYRTVIRHEQDGLLVPPADETALAVGLCRLLSDDALRARLAAAGHVKAQAYSWGKISRQVFEVYEETIEAFKRRPSGASKKGSYNGAEWHPAASGVASSSGSAAVQSVL